MDRYYPWLAAAEETEVTMERNANTFFDRGTQSYILHNFIEFLMNSGIYVR